MEIEYGKRTEGRGAEKKEREQNKARGINN